MAVSSEELQYPFVSNPGFPIVPPAQTAGCGGKLGSTAHLHSWLSSDVVGRYQSFKDPPEYARAAPVNAGHFLYLKVTAF